MTEKGFPRREELHPARRPDEQRSADLVFERPDLTADGRLRDVEALGGAAHVAFFGDGDEVADLSEAHA